MKKIFAGLLMVSMAALFGCGGGSKSDNGPVSANPAATGKYTGTYVSDAGAATQETGIFTVAIDDQGNISGFTQLSAGSAIANAFVAFLLPSPNGLPTTTFAASNNDWVGTIDTVNGSLHVDITTFPARIHFTGNAVRSGGTLPPTDITQVTPIPFTPEMLLGKTMTLTSGQSSMRFDTPGSVTVTRNGNTVTGTYTINSNSTLTIVGGGDRIIYTLRKNTGFVLTVTLVHPDSATPAQVTTEIFTISTPIVI